MTPRPAQSLFVVFERLVQVDGIEVISCGLTRRFDSEEAAIREAIKKLR
jgi:hypothetical protein